MPSDLHLEAYEEAKRRIADVASSGEKTLNLAISDLDLLPPEISNLHHITALHLDLSSVQDLSPISSLKALETLSLSNSPIEDISAISGLGNLKNLDIHLTQVRDLSPISNLKSLEVVDLAYCGVGDVSVFSGFKNLRSVNMKNNGVLDFRPFRDIEVDGPNGHPFEFFQVYNQNVADFDPELVGLLDDGKKAIIYLREIDDIIYDRRLKIWRRSGRTSEEFVDDQLPLAEEIRNESEFGTFSVFPIAVSNPPLLAATLGQVSDAIDDVLENSSNGLSAASLEVRKLRRTLDRYANDPQRIEMDFTSVHAGLVRQVGLGELPASSENEALISALHEGALGIRATSPKIAENRLMLQAQELHELSPDAIGRIADAGPVLESITDGELRAQMREDVLLLTNEMRIGPPLLGGARHEGKVPVGRDEAVRVLGRSARMLLILRHAPEFVDKLHQSTGLKAAEIILTLVGLVGLAVKLMF